MKTLFTRCGKTLWCVLMPHSTVSTLFSDKVLIGCLWCAQGTMLCVPMQVFGLYPCHDSFGLVLGPDHFCSCLVLYDIFCHMAGLALSPG